MSTPVMIAESTEEDAFYSIQSRLEQQRLTFWSRVAAHTTAVVLVQPFAGPLDLFFETAAVTVIFALLVAALAHQRWLQDQALAEECRELEEAARKRRELDRQIDDLAA